MDKKMCRFGLNNRLPILLTLVISAIFAARPPNVAANGPSVLPTRILAGHSDAVHAVMFFPDGKRIASGSADRTIRIWDVATGRSLMTLAGHEGAIWAIDISPDGKFLASAGDDLTARVWDANTGDQIAQMTGHTRTIRGVGFLPNNQLITGASSGDGTVRIWDIAEEKEVWRIDADHCVLAMCLSKDRRRVAFGGCGGAISVWDLVNRKRLAKFTWEASNVINSVGLSADGSQVVTNRGVDLNLYDIAAGAWAEETPWRVQQMTVFGMSPDREWLCDITGEFVNAKTGETKARLGWINSDYYGKANCATMSSDNRWAALGTGGSPIGVRKWNPGRSNFVHLYKLPESTAVRTDRSPSGSITWEAIPVRLRDEKGALVPVNSRQHHDMAFSSDWQVRTGNFKPLDGGKQQPLDLLFNSSSIYLHRELGMLDRIECNDINLCDAAWDGKRFWIASSKRGIFAVEPDGKPGVVIDSKQGLPVPCNQRVTIHPLEGGKLLAAGSSSDGVKPDGWCALIEPDTDATSYHVKIIFHETDLPGWRDKYQNRNPNNSNFNPIYMTEPPGTAPNRPREVWIVCEPVPRSERPVVRVNTANFTYTSYNLSPQGDEKSTEPKRPLIFDYSVRPCWLSDSILFMRMSSHWFTATVEPDQTFIDLTKNRLVCYPESNINGDMLQTRDTLYLPGEEWLAVDRETLKVRVLGKGLFSDKYYRSHPFNYFVSAHLGLAAFSPEQMNLYRISIDPAHSLTHSTPADAVLRTEVQAEQNLIEFGNTEYGPGTTTFRGGTGELSFRNMKLISTLKTTASKHPFVGPTPFDRGVNLNGMSGLISQLAQFESERNRIAVTAEQWARLKVPYPVAVIDNTPQALMLPFSFDPFSAEDRNRIESLFAEYSRSNDPATQNKLAATLTEEARRTGDKWSIDADNYIRGIISVLSQKQWDLLMYKSIE